MTRVEIGRQADADIGELLERLRESAGMRVTDKYASDLQSIFDRLSMFPAIGSPRSELGRHARIAVLSPYIVIYDYVANMDHVTIVRVIDGRRNITRRLVRE